MINIIDNIEDFESIKEECNRLADNLQMPLLRYEWLINCAKVISDNTKLQILVLYSDGRVKAIAPLVIEKKFFTETLALLGTSLHGEPCGFLYEDAESLNELLEAVTALNKTICFKGIKSASLEAFKLEQVPHQIKKTAVVKTRNIPYLPIVMPCEKFQHSISSSRRSGLRRLLRIVFKMGKPSVEIVCPTPDSLDKYLDEIYKVEASGWKQRMGTAMMLNKKLGSFFRSYSKEAAILKILRLCFLRIDGIAVAVQIGIEYANRFWILKIGYDEKWSKCSPGILLMNEVINYAFSKNLDAVEFLGSNENWIHIWTNHFHKIATYRIYNSSVSGLFDLAYTYINRVLEKMHCVASKKQVNSGSLSNV